MNALDRELEQLFLKLPTLNQIGMALLEFTRAITKLNVEKRAGAYFFGFVGFSFPSNRETIRMHVNLEPDKVDARDSRWLPLESRDEFYICDITSARQLGQSTRYIEYSYDKNVTARLLDSPYIIKN